jgi:hypothetical protein
MGQSASVQKGTHFNLSHRMAIADVDGSRDLYRGIAENSFQSVVAISKEKERIMKSLPVLAILLMALGVSWAGQKQPEKRLPYAAIHDPQFIPASSATFLHDPDRVIGVVSGQMAKAYPAAILSQHGLVEDQSPSGPIAITW